MSQSESDAVVTGPDILFFGHHGGFQFGGGARLMHILAILEQLHVNTQLISYLPDEKFGVKHERKSQYLNITTVSVPRFLPRIFRAPFLLLVLLYGLRYVRGSKIVFSHGPTSVYGAPALILARIFRKPLLLDHEDTRTSDTPKFIYNVVRKSPDIVFPISRYLEKEAKELGCRKVVYLPIFLDANFFKKDDSERARIRKSLGIRDTDIVVGYAGSFSRGEGVPFLVRAFKNLSHKHENAKLVVIGGRNVADSDDVAGLMNELALKDRAVLVPPQTHGSMPKYLSAFDIACSPKTDCEANRAANPVKIYEYMSMGLPMVASAVGEITNVIDNGYDGFLVKPGDESDLETTLEYVIQNLASAKEVGERAREKIIKHYSQQAFLKTIRDALNDLNKS